MGTRREGSACDGDGCVHVKVGKCRWHVGPLKGLGVGGTPRLLHDGLCGRKARRSPDCSSALYKYRYPVCVCVRCVGNAVDARQRSKKCTEGDMSCVGQ